MEGYTVKKFKSAVRGMNKSSQWMLTQVYCFLDFIDHIRFPFAYSIPLLNRTWKITDYSKYRFNLGGVARSQFVGGGIVR